MVASSRQSAFLELIQERVDRYKPILEDDFGVTLGAVAAMPLRAAERINSAFGKSDSQLHKECLDKHGRPPLPIRWALHQLEKVIVWLPAYALVWFRYWYPDFMMKWDSATPAVLVSFAGWSAEDYHRHAAKLDQWTVHEMAHGVWSQLAQDEDDDHTGRWRLWNEGFAHYLADVYMRKAYPVDTRIDLDWSKFRLEGKQLVTDVVDRNGQDSLRTIPTHWQHLDSS